MIDFKKKQFWSNHLPLNALSEEIITGEALLGNLAVAIFFLQVSCDQGVT
jgi:hypothetical protein